MSGMHHTNDKPLNAPPLVIRVGEELPLAIEEALPRPARPQPGFWQAVLWCIVFLVVLYGGTIFFAATAWGVAALASGNPQQFFQDDWAALETITKEGKSGFPRGMSNAIVWGMLLSHLLTLGFVWLVLRVKVGPEWKRELALHRPSVWHIVLALAATPGLMILHGAFHEAIHAIFRQPMSGEMAESLKSMFAPWPWPMAVLVVGVLPGLLEELWCRGFLGRGLVARNGFLGGILLTSILFGCLHILPLYALGTMFMGMCLHLTYVLSRSLWVPILIHTVNNAVTILATVGVIHLGGLEQEAAGLDRPLYLASCGTVLFAFAAMWTARVRIVPRDADRPRWRAGYPNLALPPIGENAALVRRRPNLVVATLALASVGAWFFLLLR